MNLVFPSGVATAATGDKTMTAPYASAGWSASGVSCGQTNSWPLLTCLGTAAADAVSGELVVAAQTTGQSQGIVPGYVWVPFVNSYPMNSYSSADSWVDASHTLSDSVDTIDYGVTVAVDHAATTTTGTGYNDAWVSLSASAQHSSCASCWAGAGRDITSVQSSPVNAGVFRLTFRLVNQEGGPVPPGQINIRIRLSAYAERKGFEECWYSSACHSSSSAEAAATLVSVVASPAATPDTDPPETTITSSPPATSDSRTATFEFSSNEPDSTFTCRLDSGDVAPCVSPVTHTDLTDGNHSFEVVATDSTGNADATPASWTWTIDATAPDTIITAGPQSLTNQDTATFSFAATEDRATFECKLDGGAFSACSSPTSYTGLGDGNHAFEVRALDAAGNIDATPASSSWTIDTTAPDPATLISPANGSSTSNTTPSFDWDDITDLSGVNYEFQLDNGGGAFSTPEVSQSDLTTSTYTPAGPLTAETYSWRVRATDAAGNFGAWSDVFTITITAPPGAIAGKVTSQTTKKALDGATVDCGTAGRATTATDGTYSITNVTEGSYSCTASASGHRSLTKSVMVSSNNTTTANFALRKA